MNISSTTPRFVLTVNDLWYSIRNTCAFCKCIATSQVKLNIDNRLDLYICNRCAEQSGWLTNEQKELLRTDGVKYGIDDGE